MIVLLCLLGGIVLLRGPVLFEIDLWRNLKADALDEEFIDRSTRLSDAQYDRAVRKLWETGKLHHRREAITFIRFKMTKTLAADLGKYRPYIQEALADPDSSLRESALNTFVRTEGDRAVPQLLAHLADSDHFLRIVAMRHLRGLRQTNALPAVAGQLPESNPKLVCEAVNWLQRITGVDHGMKSKWISRRVDASAGEMATNYTRYLSARDAARAWWNANSGDWQVIDLPKLTEVASNRRISLDQYHLSHADLSAFDTSVLKGKPVLLYFFVSWKSAAGSEIPDVNRLFSLVGGKLNVLGISLDAVPDEHNENQHTILLGDEHSEHDHGHHHHDHGEGHEMPYEVGEVIALTEKKLREEGAKFPVVYDMTGRLAIHLDALEVPVFVLLDSERRIVRRMAGPRRAEALLSIVGQVGVNPPVE